MVEKEDGNCFICPVADIDHALDMDSRFRGNEVRLVSSSQSKLAGDFVGLEFVQATAVHAAKVTISRFENLFPDFVARPSIYDSF
jgi:hypothetical protein